MTKPDRHPPDKLPEGFMPYWEATFTAAIQGKDRQEAWKRASQYAGILDLNLESIPQEPMKDNKGNFMDDYIDALDNLEAEAPKIAQGLHMRKQRVMTNPTCGQPFLDGRGMSHMCTLPPHLGMGHAGYKHYCELHKVKE